MKTFVSSLIASLAIADYSSSSYNKNSFGSVRQDTGFGTTGHYGNSFRGGGKADHDGNDHIYGLDSVKSRKDLKIVGSATQVANAAILASVLTQVEAADDDRKDYLEKVYLRRSRRLYEVHLQNLREIAAPFDYQENLLEDERFDVTQAMVEAS